MGLEWAAAAHLSLMMVVVEDVVGGRVWPGGKGLPAGRPSKESCANATNRGCSSGAARTISWAMQACANDRGHCELSAGMRMLAWVVRIEAYQQLD